MQYISNSYEDTINIAKQFAKTLSAGDVVLLNGDLFKIKYTAPQDASQHIICIAKIGNPNFANGIFNK